MKNRIWFLALFIIGFIIKSNAQLAPKFSVSLSLEQDTVGLLDPWFLKIAIRNISEGDIDFLPTSIITWGASESAEFKLEIKNKKSLDWMDANIIRNMCISEGYNYVKLKPNEVRIYEFRCPSPIKMLDIGTNELRASFSIRCNHDNKSRIYSAPICIQVKEYNGQDLAAYEYLMKSPNPNFIFYPIVATVFDTSNIAKTEILVNRYPEAFFAEYGRASLNRLYLAKANFNDFYSSDREKTLFYLWQAKKYGVLALESKNSKILEAVNNQMSQLLEVAERAYDFDLPESLQKEFYFKKY